MCSVDDLSPIGLNDLDNGNAEMASIASASSRLRGRVFQVSEFAGSAADSANKVITGVVDSSWTAIRGLIVTPAPPTEPQTPSNLELVVPADSPLDTRPRGNSTAFSLSSVTASVAGIAAAATNRNRSRTGSRTSALDSSGASGKPEASWKGNEEMIEVPSHIRSLRDIKHDDRDENVLKSDEEESLVPVVIGKERRRSDARSIQSVSSVMSREKEEAKVREAEREREREREKERVSLSDRLASIGMMGRVASSDTAVTTGSQTPPLETTKQLGFFSNLTLGRSTPPSGSGAATGSTHSRRVSLLGREAVSPAGSVASLPALAEFIDPPIDRFMTCELPAPVVVFRGFWHADGVSVQVRSAI